MARGDSIKPSHIDLMFKSCVGHHDSVRGAVQSLLAELAVDDQVQAQTAAHILRCATRVVDVHRSDMIFFVDKLMSVSVGNSGYSTSSQLSQLSPTVLGALLDLLWHLLESSTDLNEPKRGQLVDYVVEVLRLSNARVLRAHYIATFIGILQDSARRADGDLSVVRVFSAYEGLLRILSLFDVLATSPNNSGAAGRRLDNPYSRGGDAYEYGGGNSGLLVLTCLELDWSGMLQTWFRMQRSGDSELSGLEQRSSHKMMVV
jgi:hypothetical protein